MKLYTQQLSGKVPKVNMKSPPRPPDVGGDARVPETHALTLPRLHTQELPGTKGMTGGAGGAGEGGRGRLGGYRILLILGKVNMKGSRPLRPRPSRSHTPVK